MYPGSGQDAKGELERKVSATQARPFHQEEQCFSWEASLSIDRSVFVSDGLKVGHLIISTSEKFGELRFLSCVHYHCDQHHSFVRNKRRMDTE